MVVFKSKSPNAEVIGESILALVEGMGAFKSTALKILSENGVENPTPGNWYSLQSYLNAYKILYEKLGDMTLKVIGMKIPEKAVLPPDLDSIEKLLIHDMLDKAYNMNIRGGENGFYKYEKKGKKNGIMTCTNPFPCAFDIGLINGFMNKLRCSGDIPRVKHVEGPCRMKGEHMCKYEISW
ncbi:MAG: hypothetical protein ACFFAO_12805 [Candidatus Hermodarchaeota archaeon]